MNTATAVRPSSPPPSVEFRLHKQMEAAKVLREQIADIAAGDSEFIRDTIEGETGLHEMIGAVTASLMEDVALADGIARLVDELESRKDRMIARAETKRALIASAMEIGALAKVETAAGTISARPIPPKALITEEADIPAKFWKPGAPSLDKRAVLEALKLRRDALDDAMSVADADDRAIALSSVNADYPEIPGATLSNGGRTISIRVK